MSQVQKPETQNTQVQNLTLDELKKLAVEIINRNKEKILDELMSYSDDYINEIIEKVEAYAKFKLGLYEKDSIKNSIEFYHTSLKNILKMGWTIDDLVCELDNDYTTSSKILVLCRTPNSLGVNITIRLKEEQNMTKQEYIEYSRVRNELLVKKYEKIIEKINEELSKCREQLRKYEEEHDEYEDDP